MQHSALPQPLYLPHDQFMPLPCYLHTPQILLNTVFPGTSLIPIIGPEKCPPRFRQLLPEKCPKGKPSSQFRMILDKL